MASKDPEAGDAPALSIVVPTHDRVDKLRRLLDSHYAADLPQRTEVVVVADSCGDGTEETIGRLFPTVRVVRLPATPGASGGCSVALTAGLLASQGDLVFFVDDDNVVDPGCIVALVRAFENRRMLGAVGPLSFSDRAGRQLWCAGAVVGPLGTVDHRAGELPCDPADPEVTTACDYLPNAFLTSRQVLDAVPLDPAAFPHNWAELDWGLRLQDSGLELRVATGARVWHDVGYAGPFTRMSERWTADQGRSRVRMHRRHPGRMGPVVRYLVTVFPLATLAYAWALRRDPKRLGRLVPRYCASVLEEVSRRPASPPVPDHPEQHPRGAT
jgi:GT2 family glycosyltransferase